MSGRSRVLVHPLAIAAMPIPAIVGVLVAPGVGFGIACLAVGIVVSACRGVRFAAGMVVLAVSGVAVLWLGFALSLPAEPLGVASPRVPWLPLQPTADQAIIALRGGLRIVSIMVLYLVALAFVRWPVLRDTLIDRFSVPYRVVDVIGLGGRFAMLMRRDIALACSLARLRTRGRPLRSLRLLAGMSVPVLIASFRHADELTIAMEARGFGAREERTVHDSQPLRITDGAVLFSVWAVSILGALLMG